MINEDTQKTENQEERFEKKRIRHTYIPNSFGSSFCLTAPALVYVGSLFLSGLLAWVIVLRAFRVMNGDDLTYLPRGP